MSLKPFFIVSLIVCLGAGVGIWIEKARQPVPSQPVAVQNSNANTTNLNTNVAAGTGALIGEAPRRPTNFGALGTLVFDGQTPYLLLRGQRTELVLDALSVCAAPTGGIPCMAMSVTLNVPFDNKPATVEGELQAGKVLVRKLQVVEDIASAGAPATGVVYIPWMEARQLLLSCSATLAVQSHNGNLDLTLTDRSKVRAVQPVLDEVFRVLEEGAREKCPSLAVATE